MNCETTGSKLWGGPLSHGFHITIYLPRSIQVSQHKQLTTKDFAITRQDFKQKERTT